MFLYDTTFNDNLTFLVCKPKTGEWRSAAQDLCKVLHQIRET